MRAENMQIYMRIPMRNSSSCLTARFTHLRPEPEHLWEPRHSLFLLLRGIITIRDHKWNLSRLSRITIGQSLRARRKGVIRRPIRVHTYAPSRESRQLSSNSLCVPPLSFFPSSPPFPRGPGDANGPATGYRFRCASWSGTFRPVPSRAPRHCLAEIRRIRKMTRAKLETV